MNDWSSKRQPMRNIAVPPDFWAAVPIWAMASGRMNAVDKMAARKRRRIWSKIVCAELEVRELRFVR